MQCERCMAVIAEGEERQLHGQVLCEDCIMDLLSPAKACDPWAVYSAKMSVKKQGNELQLNPVQQEILAVLREEGSTEPRKLAGKLKIKETDMERELATLRHMEKVRGELKDGKRLIRVWGQ